MRGFFILFHTAKNNYPMYYICWVNKSGQIDFVIDSSLVCQVPLVSQN